MKESTKVFITTIIITGIVVLLTTAGTVLFLYQTAVEEQKERLLEFVKTQANFIRVVHEENLTHVSHEHEQDHLGCSEELINIFVRLSQLQMADEGPSDKKRPVLNVIIAERKGENVTFHLGDKRLAGKTVPFEKIVNNPMGLALNGVTNVLETKDHMGGRILCAFTNVQEVELGLVAKIFLDDLRQPFANITIVVFGCACVLLLISGLIMRRMVSPFVTELAEQKTTLAEKNVVLEEQAITDSLTQLYNRSYFNEQLKYEFARLVQGGEGLSIIMFDIDHFKKINDTLGHLAGDSVLKELSELIQNNIRHNDTLARWGGEEFAILMSGTDKKRAEVIAIKLCAVVSEHHFSINRSVTCSFGVTDYQTGESAMEFINRADKGLYRAKDLGRNRVISI